MKWKSMKRTQPKKGDEYLVIWNLYDNQYPVVTSMDWDAEEKCWTDPRSGDHPLRDPDSILYWSPLPPPKKGIDKSIWFTDAEQSNEELYESIVNDPRIVKSHDLKTVKYNPNPFTVMGRKPNRNDFIDEQGYLDHLQDYLEWEERNNN